MRDSRRPATSLSAVAEATQVRWNRTNPYLLATAHDGDVKVWDQRKGTAPVQYIAAHLSKIHGLDWSPTSDTQLATSSQDNTVKFFDTNSPRRAECILNTNSPVWRARYTPFGNGLVTVVVPQLRRGENSLLLWNIANRATPVHTFIGHRDVVLEFEWRKQRQTEADFQLITWSKDQTLLIWRIEPFLQKLCGHEPEEPHDEYVTEDALETASNASTNVSSVTVHPLYQEFSLLNVHIPNLEVVKMDPVRRFCTVRAKTKNYFIILQVTFPNTYPHGVPPNFQMASGSSIEENKGQQVLQTLTHIAQQRVLKNRTCLEPCLRQLVATLEQLASDSENNRHFDAPYMDNANIFGSNDAYIPFPRTSGAKFSSVGILVCFGRPVTSRRLSGKLESTTPRTLSAIGNLYGGKRSTDLSITNFYYQKQRSRNKHGMIAKPPKAMVTVYDASGLFYVSKQLGAKYLLDGDVGTVCKYNATAAATIGRMDLVQAWKLAELIASPQQAEDDMQWSMHPFGSQLMQSL